MLSAYFRDIAHKKNMLEILHDRDVIQQEARNELKARFAHFDIELVDVLIGKPDTAESSGEIEQLLEQLRLRRSGAALFADLRVSLDRTLPFERAHRIARELEEKLAQAIPGLDAVVHTDPVVAPDEALDGGILNFIRTRGLDAHHLSVTQEGGKFSTDLHLEVDSQFSLREAHELASSLEKDILEHFLGISAVQIHIEEVGSISYETIAANEQHLELREQITTLCKEIVGEDRCHKVSLHKTGGRLTVTLHCLFPGDQTVAEVHRQTTQLEEILRRDLPQLDRVLIHAEPLN